MRSLHRVRYPGKQDAQRQSVQDDPNRVCSTQPSLRVSGEDTPKASTLTSVKASRQKCPQCRGFGWGMRHRRQYLKDKDEAGCGAVVGTYVQCDTAELP